MPMTPQQLIDMPGAGNAEKQLRKEGRWRLTAIDFLNNIPQDHCTDSANVLIDKAISQLEDYTCN